MSDNRAFKKRNLIAASICYWFIALSVSGLAVILVGDCPTALTETDYQHCVKTADDVGSFTLSLSLIGYLIFMCAYVLRHKRR